MPEKLSPLDFISASAEGVMLDVRSPGEFERAHIPGAISFPMFNNEERAAVGTCYKKEGKDKAVELGLSIVGPKLATWVKSAKKLSQGKPVLIHCWRGGMRSGSMAWLLETAGLQVKLLIGGYKAYRHLVLNSLANPIPLRVLGGKTGSGKTEILLEMKKRGFQVIDLEGIAHHRGSAFGHLGLAPQPSSEHFENVLFHELCQLDLQKTIWVEDESRHIGKVFMNLEFYNQLRDAPVLFLDIDAQYRLPYLVKVYAQYPKELLAEAIEKIKKRLGGQHYQKALDCLDLGEFEEVAAITLQYYDKAYLHGLEQRNSQKIHRLEVHSLDTQKQVDAILPHLMNA
ncbi:tRNA 2-selenouridine(34) synthase MnmH [Aquirufa aurantiipilula]|uniref:tRNA 2-selenouridine(34) synthase MnmH n=1 Tax=Aquirufa aurantiipilula TaxID=2696561 RepID=A0ABT6BKI4_9BACT|nr:tRNA 2-selenouridine(34) synthase MnmH [Aquirufa aurantiipilula]MBZ1326526.1 tRNA 2-selenouridine(34) synthase MnmH [Aquirufa aurantiipilula]MDF5690874.1 tRNA 2-selenouridine(34) synthase MnmH [Aquirufa aurantiipilula]